MNHQKVADTVGRSRTAVTNLLRLLTLNEDVRKLLLAGKLDMGHARALLALPADAQGQVARLVAQRDLSVRETEALVRRRLRQPAARKKSRSSNDADIRSLQDELAERLGAKVRINHKRSGRGQLTIDYNSIDELEGILDHIR